MTVTNTPRLGLMSPIDSDLFLSADFRATNNILDATPGTTIVANYAALLALNWNVAQHGSRVLQVDTGAEWFWNNPSGVGAWKRLNSVGELKYVVQSAPITTTLTASGPTFISSGSFVIPGGRSIFINLIMGLDNSQSTEGIAIVTLFDGGTQITEANFRCGNFINSAGAHHELTAYIRNATPNSTHTVNAVIRSAATTRGTTAARASILQISEV